MRNITIIYHSGYWDGMLSGVLQYDNKRYWFSNVFDDYCGYRIFAIYELTEEEWTEEDYWHSLFETHVGTHTRHKDEAQFRAPREQHKLFYDAQKKANDEGLIKGKNLDNKTPIGYFDWHECKFRNSIHRDYFIHGEQRKLVHDDHCCMFDTITWRTDANSHHIDETLEFEERAVGWCMRVKDAVEDYWLLIEYCPWCGKLLPSKDDSNSESEKTRHEEAKLGFADAHNNLEASSRKPDYMRGFLTGQRYKNRIVEFNERSA